QHHSGRFSNILAAIDALDPDAFDYYGRAGALYFETVDSSSRIQVQAKTVNGNYGKTFPGINIAEGNTAAEGRPLIIQDLVTNATYRTSVGIYNTSDSPYTVRLTIIDANNVVVGTYFDKSLGSYAFMSFNPFTQAGVTSGTYENCWLLINVTSGGSAAQGVMCYGSIANNTTNDTYALIARMYN
ncbi:MAG: hypothetical protein OEW05_15020, partial [Candidatus Aminicenantes bacterium]|nr:hypothetical protein [Candidatus Aminicenantes bacterium]